MLITLIYVHFSLIDFWCRKMVKCPKCGSENIKPLKSWQMTNPKSQRLFKVSMMLCQNCRKRFRIAEKI